ncbi:hypothetical protein CBL_21314, partial [Carabus blaptoides fortunei]
DLADKPSVDVSMNSVRTKGDLIISPRSEIICTGTRENPQSNTGYEEAVSVANRKSDCTGNHRVMNVNEFDIATQFQAKHLKPIPAHLRPTDLEPPDPNVSDPDTSDHESDNSNETEVSATHTELDSDERFTDNDEP